MLRMALQGPGKNIAVLCDEKSSEVVIFNMDSPNVRKTLLNSLQRHPERPAIVMGIENPGIGNTTYIPKPVRINEMMRVIKNIQKNRDANISSEKRHSVVDIKPRKVEITDKRENASGSGLPGKTLFEAFPNTTPAKDHISPGHKEACFYNPKDFIQETLFHAMEESLKRQTAMRLSLLSGSDTWESIIFFPDENKVWSSMNEIQMKQLCTTPLCLIHHSLQKNNDKEIRFSIVENGSHENCDTFDSFKMKIALWTSEGRVPVGTDLSSPVVLARWPNLTRLPAFPNAMRIAALLIDQPRSLSLITRVLNLPQREIFEFYCSALALGIVATASNGSDSGSLVRKHHRHRSLFGNILKHLRGRDS